MMKMPFCSRAALRIACHVPNWALTYRASFIDLAVFTRIQASVVEIDTTDGLRVTFDRGVVIHLRASGNAPELRCYTEATTAAAAEDLSRCALIILRDELLPLSHPD